VAVLAAMWGAGIGALITREILSSALGAILLWAVYPYRPRLQLLAGPMRQLLRYGAWIGLGLSVLYLSQNVDILVGGHIIHSREDIGFYTTSWSLAFLLASVFTLLAGSMVFPALSRLEGEAFRATLLRALRLLSLLMLPAAVLLASVAPVAIVPVLGGRWVAYRHMYPVLSLLAVYAGVRSLLALFLEGYKAVGKPWLVWAYNMVKLAVLLPVMVFAAQRGILGLAVAYLPVQIIEIPLALLLARAYLSVTPGSVAAAVRVPLAATVAMAAVVLGIENIFRHLLHVHELPTLLVCVAIAGPVYVAALHLQDATLLPDTAEVLAHGLVG
jgi:O-antigen/teichoic acid export membrane protein